MGLTSYINPVSFLSFEAAINAPDFDEAAFCSLAYAARQSQCAKVDVQNQVASTLALYRCQPVNCDGLRRYVTAMRGWCLRSRSGEAVNTVWPECALQLAFKPEPMQVRNGLTHGKSSLVQV